MNSKENQIFRITGMMSGTSLDGMDLAGCSFTFQKDKWSYTIEHAVTYPYSGTWSSRLQSLRNASAREISQTHFDFGRLAGEMARCFHKENSFDPLLIASHGHTVFHDPANGYTTQIGSGAAIAATSEKPVVCDFRAIDVCLSGQGAPLVPFGDQLLFGQYEACLNLGGFSNISFNREGKRIAFDICPVNIVLNQLANELGLDYDRDGRLARQGEIILPLFEALNGLPFYDEKPPKSLGAEWLKSNLLPLLRNADCSIPDKLRTMTEHIALQITKAITGFGITNLLITGGGAHNKFLIEKIKAQFNSNIVLPDKLTIDYKEALIFALLGLLRWIGLPNCLASATGAKSNSIGGAVYLPLK